MVTQIFTLLCSLFLVVFCANYLVEGSSVIAKKLGASEFVIGLLIVGMGTSLPELVVSLVASIEGNTDVALGNVIGSNIFNTGAILGLSALIAPLIVSEANSRRDIPFMLMATALFLLFGISGGGIDRIEGIILIGLFGLYLVYLFKTDGKQNESTHTMPSGLMFQTLPGSIAMVIGCIIGLVTGGRLLVDSAVTFGTMVGMTDKAVGITILAFGTSLPELATCVAAIKKRHNQMALGDIIGTNIFNILVIIGVSSLIHPLGFKNINIVDLVAFSLCMIIVYLSQHTTHPGKVTRFDGACMLVVFIAYMIMLFNI